MSRLELLEADDIALTYRIKDLGQAETTLTEDLASLCSYFNTLRLKPSESKTEVCAFHLNNKQANRKFTVQCNDCTLRQNKHPGITLDRTLSYRRHLENTAAKVKTRNTIQKLRRPTRRASAAFVHHRADLITSRILCSSMKNNYHTNLIYLYRKIHPLYDEIDFAPKLTVTAS